MAEEEFSAEAFANERANQEEECPNGHPLSCEESSHCQKKDRVLKSKQTNQGQSRS